MRAGPHPFLKHIASAGQKVFPSPLVPHLKSPQPENTGDNKNTVLNKGHSHKTIVFE